MTKMRGDNKYKKTVMGMMMMDGWMDERHGE